MTHLGKTIVFAGGGTAGHIEPALAVARGWKSDHPQDECIFLGTDSGLEKSLIPAAGFALSTIPKVPMPRKLELSTLLFPARFIRSIFAAKRVIANKDLVVGFGGYVSAPAYLAAAISRVPIVIHDANSTIGWANKLGALFTSHLAVSQRVDSGKFMNATVTGLPLRQDVELSVRASRLDWTQARSDARQRMGWNAHEPTLLILGGSQGSVFMNQVIANSLDALQRRGFQVIHSVGQKNLLPQNHGGYKATNYINDVASAYLGADVVIARSGAVTCAEFGALGKMAIFVPLPIGNGEQSKNADFLVKERHAIVVKQEEFTPQWLEANIDRALKQSKDLPQESMWNDLASVEKICQMMREAMSNGADR